MKTILKCRADEKKNKIYPAIKAHEERRRKKIEKQIQKLENNTRQLKPIDKLEMPLHLLDSVVEQRRPPAHLLAEEVEAREVLHKWSRYKRDEYIENVAQIDKVMAAQRRAFDKIYEESEDLYNEASMPDLQFIPYEISGPVATPPIKDYNSPDGEYIDVSKKWDN